MADINRSGILTRKYKSGSIVFFEGDKSESVYILKSGKVMLTYTKIETGEEQKEEVRAGEFFGVKSAIGRYPREETAQTVGETLVLVLSVADFEKLVMGNVKVVKKMLSVFSSQLRRIGKAVREVLGETNAVDPTIELFKIGEFYFNNASYQQSLYVFKKYMTYYPDGKFAQQAMKRIKDIETGNFSSPEKAFTVPAASKQPVAENFSFGDAEEPSAGGDFPDFPDDSSPQEDLTDFDMDDSVDSAASTELTDEMDNFLSDSSDGNIGLVEDPSQRFGRAVAFKGSGDFTKAISMLQELVDDPSVEIEATDIFEKAHLELSDCYVDSGKFKESLSVLTGYIKKYPKSDNLKKAVLLMGKTYQKAKVFDKAEAYYKKVMNMPPRDDLTQEAIKLLKELNI